MKATDVKKVLEHKIISNGFKVEGDKVILKNGMYIRIKRS